VRNDDIVNEPYKHRELWSRRPGSERIGPLFWERRRLPTFTRL